MKQYIRVKLLLLITLAALLTACGGGGGGGDSTASSNPVPIGTATATWDSATWDDPNTTWGQ